MPNNITPNISPVLHVHHYGSSNAPPAPTRKSIICLATKFSHSQEKLAPQENKLAKRSTAEKIEQKNSISELISNLEVLAHRTSAPRAGNQMGSEARCRPLLDKRFAPYHHPKNNPSARGTLLRFVLKKTLAGKESNITGGGNDIIPQKKMASLKKAPSDKPLSSDAIERQRDTIDSLLLGVTHPFFINHINNIDALKNIRAFEQIWRGKINREFEKNQLTHLPLNREGVWRKIIHDLVVSYKGMAPGSMTANIMSFQKENIGVQNIARSPESLVKKRLAQHLQLDLQLVLSGIKANHRK